MEPISCQSKNMKEKHVRKLTTTGANKTYYITLPKEYVQKLKWQKGQKITVELEGKKLVVKDWKR